MNILHLHVASYVNIYNRTSFETVNVYTGISVSVLNPATLLTQNAYHKSVNLSKCRLSHGMETRHLIQLLGILDYYKVKCGHIKVIRDIPTNGGFKCEQFL